MVRSKSYFMESNIDIRKIMPGEIHLLDQFLYDAIFIPEGVEKPEREIIQLPQIAVYIQDFGKETDLCLVAEYNNYIVGAIWTRIFSENQKGFGFIDEKTPELSMSVKEQYRGKGIGTALLKAMIDLLKMNGFQQVSLSVDVLNYAFGLYQKLGFELVKYEGESATMIKNLNN